METAPTSSPGTAKSLLVPPLVPTLALYGACIVISQVPNLFPGDPYLRHFWTALPLGLVEYSLPVLLFLSVFAINSKQAILVPIGGVLATALLSHYVRPDEITAGIAQVLLREDLWHAIKEELPTALLISGLAMIAARWWAPRAKAHRARFVIPQIKPALILFAASVAVYFVITAASIDGQLVLFPLTIIYATAAAFAVIAMCFICAVTLKRWTAALPLALVVAWFAPFYLRPSFCRDGGGCWDFIWPLLRTSIFAATALFLLSVLAGVLARDAREPEAD